MFEDIDTNTVALKSIGWLIVLIIFMTIPFIRDSKFQNKKPLYVFAFLSWATLVFLPYFMNTEYGLGKIEDVEEYDDTEMLGVSFQRTIPNTIITVIYFVFFVNAIITKMDRNPPKPGSKPGTRIPTPPISKAGENYKVLASSLSNQFSTTVYIAIFIVLINVFSTGYLYYNCEDKNSSYLIRSIVISQYNIVIITVLGVITYIVSKQMN